MALTLFRRHTTACIEKRRKGGDQRSPRELQNDRAYRRCSCPIQAEGTLRLDGFIRRSTGETNWETAEAWKTEAEARGTLEEVAEPEKPAGPKSVLEATEAFTSDATARNLDAETLKKYRVLFDQLKAYATAHGLESMPQFDVPAARGFRGTWVDRGISATKKLERLKSFGNFCTNSGWMPLVTPTRNGMRSAFHALLAPPEESLPTMPYTREMMVKIVGAIERMPTRGADRELTLRRLKLFIFAMRYGGLAIVDAATLTRDRIDDQGRLFLHRAKTGVAVMVKLPDYVVEPLLELPLYRGRYFFWNKQKETSKPATATGNWRRHLRKLLKLAGIDKPSEWAIAHGFRDTFAVECLNSGVTMEQLQVLLGHKSIETTQAHYAPYDPSRAKSLDDAMARVHERESAWGNSRHVN